MIKAGARAVAERLKSVGATPYSCDGAHPVCASKIVAKVWQQLLFGATSKTKALACTKAVSMRSYTFFIERFCRAISQEVKVSNSAILTGLKDSTFQLFQPLPLEPSDCFVLGRQALVVLCDKRESLSSHAHCAQAWLSSLTKAHTSYTPIEKFVSSLRLLQLYQQCVFTLPYEHADVSHRKVVDLA